MRKPFLLTLTLPLLTPAAGASVQAPGPGPAVARLWNRFCVVTREEVSADLRLQDSLKRFNPQLLAGPYEPRLPLYEEAIRLSDERTKLLRQMRDAEFGAPELEAR